MQHYDIKIDAGGNKAFKIVFPESYNISDWTFKAQCRKRKSRKSEKLFDFDISVNGQEVALSAGSDLTKGLTSDAYYDVMSIDSLGTPYYWIGGNAIIDSTVTNPEEETQEDNNA